jgi:hypothetical protein
VEVAAPPVVEVAAPKPEPPKLAPEVPTKVVLRVNSGGVDAEVVDRVSGEVLGRTGDPAGVAVARSEQPRELFVRAPLHVEEPLRITPDRDQEVAVVLKKQRPGKKKPGKGKDSALRPLNPFPK